LSPARTSVPRRKLLEPSRRASSAACAGDILVRSAVSVATVSRSAVSTPPTPCRLALRVTARSLPSRFKAVSAPPKKGSTAILVAEGTTAGGEPRSSIAAPAVKATPLPTPSRIRSGRRPCAARRTGTSVEVSARANSSAVPNRSAGTLASARSIAYLTGGGTVARTVCSEGTGSIACRAMIDCAVGPVNGGCPASIS
jgi:hypothetical protein